MSQACQKRSCDAEHYWLYRTYLRVPTLLSKSAEFLDDCHNILGTVKPFPYADHGDITIATVCDSVAVRDNAVHVVLQLPFSLGIE